jgi:hypothetical protein
LDLLGDLEDQHSKARILLDIFALNEDGLTITLCDGPG